MVCMCTCTVCPECVLFVQSVQCVSYIQSVQCGSYVQSVQCVSQLTTADSPNTCPTHCLAHILGLLELREYRSTSPLEGTVVFSSLKN